MVTILMVVFFENGNFENSRFVKMCLRMSRKLEMDRGVARHGHDGQNEFRCVEGTCLG